MTFSIRELQERQKDYPEGWECPSFEEWKEKHTIPSRQSMDDYYLFCEGFDDSMRMSASSPIAGLPFPRPGKFSWQWEDHAESDG